MSVVVAEGVVEVVADANGVPRDVARDIDRNQGPMRAAGMGMGRTLGGGLMKGVALLGGVAAIGTFFTGAITGASDMNETVSKSNTIFGKAGGEIRTFASTAAENLGLSEAAALGSLASFGNLFTQMGAGSGVAADMSKQVVQMSADLGSFNNLPTADVTEKITAALRGEYDGLKALIPGISAARVEQEAMAATGKDSADALTAQEKAAAVLAIVQKDGAAAMGDFAKTADGAANSSKIVTAQFEDQQAKLGQQLLPAWQGFLGFLSTAVIPAFSSTVEWIGKNGDTLLMLAGVVAGAAIAYYGITAAMGVYKAFQIASAAATGGLTVAQWALNAAMTANPIGIIIVAIAALVAGIIWVATQTTFFQDAWSVMVDVISTAWNWLWTNVLNPVFTAIGAIFNWLYTSVIQPIVLGIQIYVGIWAAIITWLWQTVMSPVFKAIGAIFQWLYNTIIKPVVGFITGTLTTLGNGFRVVWANYINPALKAIGAGFQWVYNNVIRPVADFIGKAIDTVGKTIHSVFGGIAKWIGTQFSAIAGAIRGPINAVIGLVNGAIRAVNSISVTIPDWVPGVGGQTFGLSIPTIPMLAKGSRNAPDTFIAGEAGPELITGARGARVYSNAETRGMLGGGGGSTIHIENVVLDAKNVREFSDVVAMIQALPQVARQGRGVRVGA